ncbi:phage tail protein [Sphingomonas kyeonggiensis]|uniref:Microcystin-dependent protein n=1 Tax=Sphingomonas kyeonggiensis TaxID=1268553 RepID=A0A7W6NX26_9SPHN|nr:tail fiber protein [Sphingomonas kyeonggiensis]MBB4098241.1 microcystin-dependent protein [Sphingomonas kyeonggiensis]
MPYVGELRIFAGTFAPLGWSFCEGQLLPISENETLFNLIGTTYGGDGQSTFGLPDLRGRVALHMGTGTGLMTYQIADKAGAEEVTLSPSQIPSHTHALLGSAGNGSQSTPENNVLASSTLARLYTGNTPSLAMAPNSISSIGGSQPHSNMQPYLCVNYIISLFGVFPSQN